MVVVSFRSRHYNRDLELPKHRDRLLQAAVSDLSGDPDVLAVYLGGSLAKGDFDVYSDISLTTFALPCGCRTLKRFTIPTGLLGKYTRTP